MKIKIDVYKTDKGEFIEADKTSDSNLAVHPLAKANGSMSTRYWTITHMPSGRIVVSWITGKNHAFEVARYLSKRVDFSKKAAKDFTLEEEALCRMIAEEVEINYGRMKEIRLTEKGENHAEG